MNAARVFVFTAYVFTSRAAKGERIATPDDIGHWFAMTRLVAEVQTFQPQFDHALATENP